MTTLRTGYYGYAIATDKVIEVFVAERAENGGNYSCYSTDVLSTDPSFQVLARNLFATREEAESELAIRVLAKDDKRVKVVSIRERVHQPFYGSLVRAPGVATNIDDTQHLFPKLGKK